MHRKWATRQALVSEPGMQEMGLEMAEMGRPDEATAGDGPERTTCRDAVRGGSAGRQAVRSGGSAGRAQTSRLGFCRRQRPSLT